MYDAPSNTWTKNADMPSAGGCGAEGAINNFLYVYAGCTGVPFGDKLFHYNPSTNSWTTVAAPPHQHAGGAGGASMGKLYLAGGSDDGGSLTNTLDVYTPGTNSWKTLAPIPSHRAGMSGRVVGGKLMMPGELQAIHRYVLETPVLENVTEEIRAVVETVWPELMSKLPPKA